MKYLPLILILIFSFSAFGQKDAADLKKQVKTFKDTNDSRYQIKYDKFEDKTSVLYYGDALNSGLNFTLTGTSIQLYATFIFPGSKLENSIDEFNLLFRASGKEWQFLRNQHLYVIADEQRFDLGEGFRDSEITTRLFFRGLQTVEVLSFKVSREQFEKIAAAKLVELKVGERVFKLKDSVQKGFSNILALGSLE